MELTPMKPDTVEVVWADAHAGAGHWAELEDADTGEHLVQTCGYLIDETNGGKKLHITVAQSSTPDGFYDHVIYIPTGMVRKMTILRAYTTASAMPQSLGPLGQTPAEKN